jgi:hypothetical protein
LSVREPDRDGADGPDETFLSRWSRRKAQARVEPTAVEPAPVEPAAVAAVPSTPAAGPTEAPAGHAPAHQAATDPALQPPAVELPDLDLLGDDSDYSAFLTPGVDADLRKRALRKLFSSPKFNVFDGLDTYRDDYTSFPALGSVVTADMRYHVERLAKKALEALDEQTAPAAPAPAAVVVATEAEPACESAAPMTPESTMSESPAACGSTTTSEPPALASKENHDRIA